MSDTAVAWLHLTDLHDGLDGQDCLWPTLRQPFLVLNGLADPETCGFKHLDMALGSGRA